MSENTSTNFLSKYIEQMRSKAIQAIEIQEEDIPEVETPLTERQIVLNKLASIRSKLENNDQ